MWAERRSFSRARAAGAFLVILFLIALGGLSNVHAAEWDCLTPGWTPGDQWGPGPDDIVPDVPPCPLEQEPQPSGPGLSENVGRPLLIPTVHAVTAPQTVSVTMPPTDTAP